MARPPLRVAVAELIGRPGARRTVDGAVEIAEMVLPSAEVRADPEVEVDLVIETIVEGLAVTGTASTRWQGPCRRCLTPVDQAVTVPVDEVFVDEPDEAETWPIEADHIDLEPVVREALMLALPLSPLCGDDCLGPDPDRFPTDGGDEPDDEPAGDPRWAVLDTIEFAPEQQTDG